MVKTYLWPLTTKVFFFLVFFWYRKPGFGTDCFPKTEFQKKIPTTVCCVLLYEFHNLSICLLLEFMCFSCVVVALYGFLCLCVAMCFVFFVWLVARDRFRAGDRTDGRVGSSTNMWSNGRTACCTRSSRGGLEELGKTRRTSPRLHALRGAVICKLMNMIHAHTHVMSIVNSLGVFVE